MKRLAMVLLLSLLGACFTGTTTPGIKRCVRVWIVIGIYTECEEGPPWDRERGVDPPQPFRRQASDEDASGNSTQRTTQPSPSPTGPSTRPEGKGSWWCTTRPDGFGLCWRARGTCDEFRGPKGQGGGSGYGECARQDVAFCAWDRDCFVSAPACVDFEKRMGRDGRMCTETAD
jgi:hypothetical protein